jgi:hypothetical protein
MGDSLNLHPVSCCAAVTALTAEALRPGPSLLRLRYRLAGDLAGVVLPPAASPERTDGLWRTTCFEAFVGTPGGEAYVELNFVPSTRWAAYAFDRYRDGMRPADAAPSSIDASVTDDILELTAAVDLTAAGLPLDAPWRVGLAAVIEERGGPISYWALAHPPGRPDFHHRDGFTLELPSP